VALLGVKLEKYPFPIVSKLTESEERTEAHIFICNQLLPASIHYTAASSLVNLLQIINGHWSMTKYSLNVCGRSLQVIHIVSQKLVIQKKKLES
jgi:hypothetical protein